MLAGGPQVLDAHERSRHGRRPQRRGVTGRPSPFAAARRPDHRGRRRRGHYLRMAIISMWSRRRCRAAPLAGPGSPSRRPAPGITDLAGQRLPARRSSPAGPPGTRASPEWPRPARTASGNSRDSRRPGHRRARRWSQRAIGVRPGRRGRHLLAEHRADGELRRVDGNGGQCLGHQRGEPRVAAEQVGDRRRGRRPRSSSRRRPADQDGQVPQVGQGELALSKWAPAAAPRCRARAAAAGYAGRRRPAIFSTPGACCRRQVTEQVVREWQPEWQPRDSTLKGGRLASRRPARRRNSVGDKANTSRTVSLKALMLANPAANATSAIGSALVSTSSCAVCAQPCCASGRRRARRARAAAQPGGRCSRAGRRVRHGQFGRR